VAQPRARRVPLQPSPQRDAPLRPRATLGSARPASLARCPRQPNPAPRDGAGVGCPGPAALAGCPRDVPSERWGERGRPRPRRSRLSFWWWLSGQRCHRVLLPLHGSNRNGPGGVGGSPPPTPLGLGRPPAPRVPAPAGTPEQGRAPAGRGGATTRRGRGGGRGPGAMAEPPLSPLDGPWGQRGAVQPWGWGMLCPWSTFPGGREPHAMCPCPGGVSGLPVPAARTQPNPSQNPPPGPQMPPDPSPWGRRWSLLPPHVTPHVRGTEAEPRGSRPRRRAGPGATDPGLPGVTQPARCHRGLGAGRAWERHTPAGC